MPKLDSRCPEAVLAEGQKRNAPGLPPLAGLGEDGWPWLPGVDTPGNSLSPLRGWTEDVLTTAWLGLSCTTPRVNRRDLFRLQCLPGALLASHGAVPVHCQGRKPLVGGLPMLQAPDGAKENRFSHPCLPPLTGLGEDDWPRLPGVDTPGNSLSPLRGWTQGALATSARANHPIGSGS